MLDYLIVGAGLYGATYARQVFDKGFSVQVIEQRSCIAGNCFDEMVQGIMVGRHGGHIFHTSNKPVWDFVNRFAEWKQYEHRIKAWVDGKVYSMPPNLNTLDQLRLKPSPLATMVIKEMFFRGYTEKQWGRPFEQVPGFIVDRIPIRYTYDDRCYTDRWQGLPVGGYTNLIQNMLDGIDVELNVTDFSKNLTGYCQQAKRVVYTGMLDSLFGYRFGLLDYRSLDFHTEIVKIDDYQGCATMNYTEKQYPWTRVMEWKHFGWQNEPKGQTVITTEYPMSEGEPYYPVNDPENNLLYSRYSNLATEIPNLRVGGRLGRYEYLDMDKVVFSALNNSNVSL